eukprot:TRINITY_DN6095_c0_g1_i1.p1 TRINITY_DN6095_c0_g1~~TRINITY_DN6095_c0_g1_i1.p1  ORF type:complete len:595 (-),score=105.56 TRINITY_DN6095_c0_g1_i1:902-2686(-)
MEPPVAVLCKAMRLWELDDSFLLEPLDSASSGTLSIGRPDGTISVIDGPPRQPPVRHPTTVFGLLGIVHLLAGPYVLVITERETVGTYRGSHVYKIKGVKILTCATKATLGKLTIRQKADEAQYLQRVRSAASSSGLFFSYSVDITTNTQKVFSSGPERKSLPLWQQADPHFLWNRHLLQPAIDVKGTDPFLIPVMQGSFQTQLVELRGKPVAFTLISRRDTKRIGTRMWRRGADREGAVANFVETEQELEVDGFVAAYVQVRGSIPLLWEQVVDLKYKPKLKLLSNDTSLVARHIHDLRERYGPVLVLDLVNQTGSEAKLGTLFGVAVDALKDEELTYHAFDFHKECKNMRYDRLDMLFHQVEPYLSKFGFFLCKGEEVLSTQLGIARTNCMDCLDRTNVTQSLLARKALETVLRRLDLLAPGDTLKFHPTLYTLFNILWADHGDDVSKQYSGTSALKGDYTRFGQRSTQGVLQDGYHSASRYFLNNFYDGVRQDGLDLLTGHFVVNQNEPSPFQEGGGEALANFPLAVLVLVLSAGMTVYAAAKALTSPSGVSSSAGFVALSWGAFSGVIVLVLNTYGRAFTNRPRLSKPPR